MIYTYPDYYKKFSCIADKCPDTCCGKWQIVIDDDSLEKYEDYNGEYREELRRKVNWKEGVFRHGRSGKCAFLRDDMLCDLYIHMGKESLCTTCREYPRHTEEFENVREVSLSLSCPEVARILMNITDKVTFVTEEDDDDEVQVARSRKGTVRQARFRENMVQPQERARPCAKGKGRKAGR